MALIALSRGLFSQVDDCDLADMAAVRWRPHRSGDSVYALSDRGLMHRLILMPQPGLMVDHINHDGLDNRRANLRACTVSQNRGNSRKGPGTTSQYKGVSWRKDARRWQAKIGIDGKLKHLGHFTEEAAAARAYDLAARSYYGDFALLNFPEKDWALAMGIIGRLNPNGSGLFQRTKG